MNRHYFPTIAERRIKQAAIDLWEAELLGRLDHQSRSGKTAATAQLLKRFDKSRIGTQPEIPAAAKKKAKGLKQERRDAAWTAGAEDKAWDDLIGPATRPH